MAQIIQYKDRTNDVSVYPITTAEAVYCNLDTDSSLCTLDNVLVTKIEGQEISRIENPNHDIKYVTTDASQGLNEIEKDHARENIGVNKLIYDLSTNLDSKALNIELKQDKLYHSQNPDDGNIKTINGVYILGPGNVDIYDKGIIGVDNSLSEDNKDSSNAIMTSVVYNEVQRLDASINEADASLNKKINDLTNDVSTAIDNIDKKFDSSLKAMPIQSGWGKNSAQMKDVDHVSGDNAIGLGDNTIADGRSSLAGGTDAITLDTAPNSLSHGHGTVTFNDSEVAFGKFNKSEEGDTIFSIGNGSNDYNRSNALEINDNKLYIYGIGGYDGTNVHDADDISCLGTIQDITYADLVGLRNDNKLIPGKKYKIIDYAPKFDTSTNGKYIRPCNVRFFDIIVTALSTNILSEDAYAIKKTNVEYYSNDTVYSVDGNNILNNNDVLLIKVYTMEDGQTTSDIIPQDDELVTYEQLNGVTHIGTDNSDNTVITNNTSINIVYTDNIKNNNTFGATSSDFDTHSKIKTKFTTYTDAENTIFYQIPTYKDFPNVYSIGNVKTFRGTTKGVTFTHTLSLNVEFDVKSGSNITTDNSFDLINCYKDNAHEATVFRNSKVFGVPPIKNAKYGEEGYYPFYINKVYNNPGTNPNMGKLGASEIQSIIVDAMTSDLEDIYDNYKQVGLQKMGVLFIYGTPETITTYTNDALLSKLYIWYYGDFKLFSEISNPSSSSTIGVSNISYSDRNNSTMTYNVREADFYYRFYIALSNNLLHHVSDNFIAINTKQYYDGLINTIPRPIKVKYSIDPISSFFSNDSTGEIIEMTDHKGNHMYFDFLSTHFYGKNNIGHTLAFKPYYRYPYGDCNNINCINRRRANNKHTYYSIDNNTYNTTLINADDESEITLTKSDSNNVYIYNGNIITK